MHDFTIEVDRRLHMCSNCSLPMTMHHGAKLGDAVLDMTMTDVNFVLERKYKESKTYVVFLACEGINF